MAIVEPMRKKYKPRCIVEAVVDHVLRLRSNCHTMRNPNTPAQQYVRSRFKLMHNLQKDLAPLLKRGFDRRLNARERWVGAYHVALGHNIMEAARYDEEKAHWLCDFSQFAICEYRSRAPKRITVQRNGHLLLLRYYWKGQAEHTSLLWAVYNRQRHQWVQGIYDTRLDGKVTACAIPSEWKDEPIEVLIGFGRDAQGRGQLRGTHHFAFAKRLGVVTVRGDIRNTAGLVSQSHQMVWRITPRGTWSWVDIVDSQGMPQRVRVWYLLC